MNVIDFFSELKDPRNSKSQLYSLQDIVFLTISAVVSGADTFVDIANFGKHRREWLSKYVNFPEGKSPSHDAINDFYRSLDTDKFQECFIKWTSEVCGITEGDLISIDGKCLRGSHDRYNNKSAIYMVSAWSQKNELVLVQKKVDEKSNEITAIPKLLDVLELKGAIISIDAMGTQKSIADKIISKGADYILALKNNQASLYEEVESRFNNASSLINKTIEKSHGRIEERYCEVINKLEFIDEASKWKNLQTVIKISTIRTVISTGKVSSESRYYISSLNKNPKDFNDLIRGHWGIENKLHWVLDVQFNEDNSRIRTGNGDQNFTTLRHIALNLLKLYINPKMSMRIKRKNAGWSNFILQEILNIT
jgi:predicted transposase YbfD/YdcC